MKLSKSKPFYLYCRLVLKNVLKRLRYRINMALIDEGIQKKKKTIVTFIVCPEVGSQLATLTIIAFDFNSLLFESYRVFVGYGGIANRGYLLRWHKIEVQI